MSAGSYLNATIIWSPSSATTVISHTTMSLGSGESKSSPVALPSPTLLKVKLAAELRNTVTSEPAGISAWPSTENVASTLWPASLIGVVNW